MRPQVWVGGVPLAGVTDSAASGLTVTHRWGVTGGGCWEATWSLALTPAERPRGVKAGARVDIWCGGMPVWAGSLPEPDWDGGEFTAEGAVREGEDAKAFTAAGVTTSTPNVAVDAAIARGALSWVRRASLSGSTFRTEGDESPGVNSVSSLLDAWSNEAGKRWAVNAWREVYAADDPTTPDWHILPGAGVLGVASEKLVGTLYGAWIDATGVVNKTPVGTGLPERAVDLRPLGVLTATRATNILTGIRKKTGAQTGWTNGIEVQASQIVSPGGIHPHLSRVRAGQLVRLLGVRDPRGLETYTDVVLGETVWDVDAGTIQLNPVDLADRDLASIVEAFGAQLVA